MNDKKVNGREIKSAIGDLTNNIIMKSPDLRRLASDFNVFYSLFSDEGNYPAIINDFIRDGMETINRENNVAVLWRELRYGCLERIHGQLASIL